MMLPVKIAAAGSAIGTAVVVGLMAYGLHSCDVTQREAEHKTALEGQKTALVADCQNDKKITKGTDNALQINYDNIDGLLSVRLRDEATANTCVPVASQTTNGHESTPTKDVHATSGRNAGITKAALYQLTADADKVRSQLLACQAFINDTWRAKGQ